MFLPKLNSESGMAMVIVLIITLLSSVLAVAYTSVITYESRYSVRQSQKVQSFFLAEAGIEKAIYFLNNRYSTGNPWTDGEGQMLTTPLEFSGNLNTGSYRVSIYDQSDEPWLPANAYLIKSNGIIQQEGSNITQGVSCIASKLSGIDAPAALSIIDETDDADEMLNFNSNAWTIDGRDNDRVFGRDLPAILIANNGDDLPGQFSGNGNGNGADNWEDQVTGGDEYGSYFEGEDAIVENPDFFLDLNELVAYFRDSPLVNDLTGSGTTAGQVTFGAPDQFAIFYADLSQGTIHFSGRATGYGVLALEGDGELFISGNFEWHGIIICAGDSYMRAVGGGNSIHVLGAVLIGDGYADFRGTADLHYSSRNVDKVISDLITFRISAWCGNWGVPLGEEIAQAN